MSALKDIFFSALCVATLMALCFFWGRSTVPDITTITRVDTVRVEVPTPYEVEVVRKVSVPVYVPTPADSVVENKESTEENARKDSTLVQVPVEVERREYKDSMYRAVVSGAVIGDIHPTLEFIEVYSTTEMSILKPKEPLFRPYVSGFAGKDVFGIGAGVEINGHHGVGADYFNYSGNNALAIRYQYKF